MPETAAAVACAVVFTEFFGYWLHMLLHSEKIEFLSRNHMIHHLVVYAPNRPMRPSAGYIYSTYDRANVLGIGLEWLLPVGIILGAIHLAARGLGVPALQEGVFVGVSLAWGWLLFAYMHDAMHLQGFWMERSSLFRRWFLAARRRHDIHHMRLTDDGRMNVNYGICFFGFDRLFGTHVPEHSKFNREGLQAAMKRYAYVFPKEEVLERLRPPASRGSGRGETK